MSLIAAQSASSFPVLNALILVPIIGALVVVLLPNSRPELMRPIGALFSSIAAALSLYVMAQFSIHQSDFQFESIQSWIPSLGINWHVGVDGISLWLVVLTGLITPIVLVAVDPHHDPTPYTARLLLLQAGSIGAFLALDLFLFFLGLPDSNNLREVVGYEKGACIQVVFAFPALFLRQEFSEPTAYVRGLLGFVVALLAKLVNPFSEGSHAGLIAIVVAARTVDGCGNVFYKVAIVLPIDPPNVMKGCLF